MKLVPTRRTDYGIRAMLFLAGRPDEFVKADAIAEGRSEDREGAGLHLELSGLPACCGL